MGRRYKKQGEIRGEGTHAADDFLLDVSTSSEIPIILNAHVSFVQNQGMIHKISNKTSRDQLPYHCCFEWAHYMNCDDPLCLSQVPFNIEHFRKRHSETTCVFVTHTRQGGLYHLRRFQQRRIVEPDCILACSLGQAHGMANSDLGKPQPSPDPRSNDEMASETRSLLDNVTSPW